MDKAMVHSDERHAVDDLLPEKPSPGPNHSGNNNRTLVFTATVSTHEHHITTPLPLSEQFFESELYTSRLHDIAHLLWLAGRPLPPRPLHQQLLLARRIIVSEAIELHLVWKNGSFFVRPLPRYLLDPDFVSRYLHNDERLAKCGRGLLFSYAALVRFECDFHIAQEHRLLPSEMSWTTWHDTAHRFLTDHPSDQVYSEIDQRYWYGELRLGRLNKIYRCFPRRLTDVLYGYSKLTAHIQKADVFSDNLRAFGASLAYLVIVLQAMQVGLSTGLLSENESFQRAAYGFSIFSVLAPLVALGGVVVIFVFLFVVNIPNTLRFERARFGHMRTVPPRLRRGRRKLESSI